MSILLESLSHLLQFLFIGLAFLILCEQYRNYKSKKTLSYIEALGIVVLRQGISVFMFAGFIFYRINMNNWWYPVTIETLDTLFFLLFIIILYFTYSKKEKRDLKLLIAPPVLLIVISSIITYHWRIFFIEVNFPFYKFWGSLFYKICQFVLIISALTYMSVKEGRLTRGGPKNAFYFFLIATTLSIYNIAILAGEKSIYNLFQSIFMFLGFFVFAINQFKSKLQIKFLIAFLFVIIIPGFLTIFMLGQERISYSKKNTVLNIREVEVTKIGKLILLSNGIGITLAGLTGFLLARKITGPIEIIVEGTKKVSEGDLDFKLDIRSNDELGDLSRDFNNMSLKLKEYTTKLNDKIIEMETIHKISKVINSSSSLEEILDFSIDTISIGYGVEMCAIMLIEKDTGELNIKVSKGFTTESTDNFSLNYTEDMEPVVIAESEDLTVPDLYFYDGLKDKFTEKDREIIDFYLCAPMRAGKDIIGLITIHKIKDRTDISEDLKEVLPVIASQIAPGIKMLKLSEEQKIIDDMDPYSNLRKTVETEINRAKEFSVSTSFINCKIKNYDKLIEKYNDEIEKEMETFINTVRDGIREDDFMLRYAVNKYLIFMPLTFKDEAEKIIASVKKIVSELSQNFETDYSIISYPDDGNSVEKILKLFS